MKIENVFSLIPHVIGDNSELSAYYPRIHQSIPGKLVETGKTPLQILDEILQTNSGSLNLEQYKKSLNLLYLWMDFLIGTCRQNPTLEKPCEEYMGWVRFNVKTIEKMKKDTDMWIEKEYNQKTLASKFEKTAQTFFPPLKELRGIFYNFEKKLYGEFRYTV